MIDISKLQEIVKLMVDNDLSEVDLQDGEETVTIKRGAAGPIVQQMPAPQYAPPMPSMPASAAPGSNGSAAPSPAPAPCSRMARPSILIAVINRGEIALRIIACLQGDGHRDGVRVRQCSSGCSGSAA
jgi:biotin carboxyl carrier protein